MVRVLDKILGIAKAACVLTIFLTLLSMVSAQVVCEGNGSETSSQETEIVFIQSRLEHTSMNRQNFLDGWNFRFAKPKKSRFFAVVTERANMNGLGNYLLI